jgi:hypothetical protein
MYKVTQASFNFRNRTAIVSVTDPDTPKPESVTVTVLFPFKLDRGESFEDNELQMIRDAKDLAMQALDSVVAHRG